MLKKALFLITSILFIALGLGLAMANPGTLGLSLWGLDYEVQMWVFLWIALLFILGFYYGALYQSLHKSALKKRNKRLSTQVIELENKLQAARKANTTNAHTPDQRATQSQETETSISERAAKALSSR